MEVVIEEAVAIDDQLKCLLGTLREKSRNALEALCGDEGIDKWEGFLEFAQSEEGRKKINRALHSGQAIAALKNVFKEVAGTPFPSPAQEDGDVADADDHADFRNEVRSELGRIRAETKAALEETMQGAMKKALASVFGQELSPAEREALLIIRPWLEAMGPRSLVALKAFVRTMSDRAHLDLFVVTISDG